MNGKPFCIEIKERERGNGNAWLKLNRRSFIFLSISIFNNRLDCIATINMCIYEIINEEKKYVRDKRIINYMHGRDIHASNEQIEHTNPRYLSLALWLLIVLRVRKLHYAIIYFDTFIFMFDYYSLFYFFGNPTLRLV